MKTVEHIYINGKFIKPHGTEVLELVNPSTSAAIGKVTLADEQDAQAAIAAAKAVDVPGAAGDQKSIDRNRDHALWQRQLCAVSDRYADFRPGGGSICCAALSWGED